MCKSKKYVFSVEIVYKHFSSVLSIYIWQDWTQIGDMKGSALMRLTPLEMWEIWEEFLGIVFNIITQNKSSTTRHEIVLMRMSQKLTMRSYRWFG